MEKIRNKKKSIGVKENDSNSVTNRRDFLKLPLSERRKILRKQSDEILEHYEKDTEWKEFQTLEIHEY